MQQKTYKIYLLIISFTCGLAIMALEVSSSRLLAPYFGASLFVWTNIIGVVMAALAAGYYFGGKLADKRPDLNNLLALIAIAGIIFLFIPWLIKPAASSISSIGAASITSASVGIFFGSLIITLALFFLPLMLLGMVSPYVIKLYPSEPAEMGRTAGDIFAISTIGSILGTFLPTLWFIPVFGTKATIALFAVILIALAFFGLAVKKFTLFFLVLSVISLISISSFSIKSSAGVIFEDESAYQYFQITDGQDSNRYLVFNEGLGVQSVYNKEKILTDGMYYDYFNVLPYLTGQRKQPFDPFNEFRAKQALIIGLAGGTVSRQFNYFSPDIKVDGVELDAKVIAAAKKYLELDNRNLTIYNQDGRIFLQYVNKKYDIVIVDAYSHEMYIPWTMTTAEFWQLIENKLSKDGLVAINVNATSDKSEILSVISNTMASVFNYVYVVGINGNEAGNYMIMAGNKNVDFTQLPNIVINSQLFDITRQVAANVKQVKFNPASMILTDDRAPVEMMTDKMIFQYFKEHIL